MRKDDVAKLRAVMLLTVPTAVMEMGRDMESLFLHQVKDTSFEEIIHSIFKFN